jgi:hypothetical protein
MTNKRLHIAVRRNQGKQLQSGFIQELASALGRQFDSARLLSLDETDLLWQKVESKVQACNNGEIPCYRRRWVESQLDELRSFLHHLRGILPNEALILFRSASEFCGAIGTDTQEVLDHALQLVSLDQEDLIAVNRDVTNGTMLSLDTDKYITGDVVVYELIIWGEEWLQALDFQLE